MDRVVLDSSAVMAHIHKEKGGKRIDQLLDALDAGANVQVFISSVNWCEILTCLHRDQVPEPEQILASLLSRVVEVPFSRTTAEAAAEIGKLDASLSLGDRACLALARSQSAAAWTTDKAWSKHLLGVKVEQLR